jgi:phosphate transport system substrate-binding protein
LAYPISTFTWILAYEQQRDAAKGKKLVDFLRWAETEGQGMEAALDFAPIPESMRPTILARLDRITLGT